MPTILRIVVSLSLSLRAWLLCFQNLPRMARCNCIKALLYIYATAKIRFKSQPCSRIRFNNFIIRRRENTHKQRIFNASPTRNLKPSSRFYSWGPYALHEPWNPRWGFKRKPNPNFWWKVYRRRLCRYEYKYGLKYDLNTMLVMQPLNPNPKFSSKVYLRWLCKY